MRRPEKNTMSQLPWNDSKRNTTTHLPCDSKDIN